MRRSTTSLIPKQSLLAASKCFTGKERDAESGLDYFGARYYSNGLGRFISADWSAKPDPVPYADIDNPQTLNLYSYVGNNPILHADSDGHAKDIQLSGKYTVQIHRNNMNDMPNVHLKKAGKEVARGTINPETRQIDWDWKVGQGIAAEVQELAEQKGLFEAAAERLEFIQRLRGGVVGGGGGGLTRVLTVLQVLGIAVGTYNAVNFNTKYESKTGLHVDPFGNLSVSNIDKATQQLPIGSQLTISPAPGGTLTLGADRVWRDEFGHPYDLYQGKDGKVHVKSAA